MAAISGLTFTVSSGSDGAAITTGNSTFAAVSGATLAVDTGWHVVNARSMRVTTTSANATGRLQAAAPVSTAYMAWPIRLWARPSANTPIVVVKTNADAVCAQIQHMANGTLRLRNQNQTAVGTTSSNIPIDGEGGGTGEYWLTLQIVGSAFRARLYPLGSSEVLWDSGSQTYGGGSFQRVSLGVDFAATADISFDSGSADDASMPSQPVSAPTVDAGPNQTVKDGRGVTLDSTITGSTTSVVWSVDDGPSTSSSQFSSTSADDPTFTADGGPGAYTLRRTANWSGGSPVSDTVVITMTPLTAEFPVIAVTASGWTNEGGAASLTEAVTDDDNNTAARSPANPSAAVAKLFLDGGLKPASGQPFTVPVRLTGPADSAFVAKLYQHNDSTLVHANSSVDVDTGDAVAGESDMYDHVISFAAADWASMPDADWTAGPVVRVEVST